MVGLWRIPVDSFVQICVRLWSSVGYPGRNAVNLVAVMFSYRNLRRKAFESSKITLLY